MVKVEVELHEKVAYLLTQHSKQNHNAPVLHSSKARIGISVTAMGFNCQAFQHSRAKGSPSLHA